MLALPLLAVARDGEAAPRAADATESLLCRQGLRQSPIDIREAQRRAGPALRPAYRRGPLRLEHDGHTVRLRVAPGSRLWLGREPLALQQLHFHRPGGDRIGGEDFPMAMHWVHKSRAGQLVTLVLPFRLGAANQALAELLPLLPAPGEPPRDGPAGGFDPTRLLPEALGHYAYDGSLTASPCTEGVRWLVIKHPPTLSPEQLEMLARRIPPNARTVQPLHGRVVIEVD